MDQFKLLAVTVLYNISLRFLYSQNNHRDLEIKNNVRLQPAHHQILYPVVDWPAGTPGKIPVTFGPPGPPL